MISLNDEKGISPLIAAVLLIAFTMAVASLFAEWAPGLVNDAQDDASDQRAEIQDCIDYNIEIRDPEPNNTVVQQTSGDEALGNISVTWRYEGEDPVQNYTDIDSPRGFGQAYATGRDEAAITTITAAPVSNCSSVTSEYTP